MAEEWENPTYKQDATIDRLKDELEGSEADLLKAKKEREEGGVYIDHLQKKIGDLEEAILNERTHAPK